MSDKYFIDTNILIYAHDRSAGVKHDRASALVQSLWNSGKGVLSTQVLQELCINLRRKANPPLTTNETRRLLQDYMSWEVVVNTPESAIHALDIEVKYKLSFWDALIIHAAEASGAETLCSEDLSDRQTYGVIRVINPFKSSIPLSSRTQ